MATSHRFWLSIAGSGPASEGLNPGQPLILSGVSTTTTDSRGAAWSVTSPAGFPRRTISYVVIGETVWCDSGVGQWTVFENDEAQLAREDADAVRPPGLFADTFLDRSIIVVPSGRERLGTLEATRFRASDLRDVPLPGWWLGMDGEIVSFALWVSDDGRPLQAEIAGRVAGEAGSGPFRMLLQVTGIDDPANQVEPPV